MRIRDGQGEGGAGRGYSGRRRARKARPFAFVRRMTSEEREIGRRESERCLANETITRRILLQLRAVVTHLSIRLPIPFSPLAGPGVVAIRKRFSLLTMLPS